MLNNNILTILFLFSFVTSSQGQSIFTPNDGKDTSMMKLTPRLYLDTADIRVLYRLEILHDTISPDASKSNNIMMLQIGKNGIDKYMDLYKQKGDSVIEVLIPISKDINEVMDGSMKFLKGTLSECVFWNYPTTDKLTTTNFMIGDSYLYEEDIPKINWKLEEGTKTILDYPCQKATCQLFGRNYTAWYTMLIPTFKGPWKFSGLPGLILEVQDEQNQISWTCIGIENTTWIDLIDFQQRNYIKTSKSDFLKGFNDYKRNPGAMLLGAGKVSSLPERAKKKRHYNPIELSE